jgi:hypothetical protein
MPVIQLVAQRNHISSFQIYEDTQPINFKCISYYITYKNEKDITEKIHDYNTATEVINKVSKMQTGSETNKNSLCKINMNHTDLQHCSK